MLLISQRVGRRVDEYFQLFLFDLYVLVRFHILICLFLFWCFCDHVFMFNVLIYVRPLGHTLLQGAAGSEPPQKEQPRFFSFDILRVHCSVPVWLVRAFVG